VVVLFTLPRPFIVCGMLLRPSLDEDESSVGMNRRRLLLAWFMLVDKYIAVGRYCSRALYGTHFEFPVIVKLLLLPAGHVWLRALRIGFLGAYFSLRRVDRIYYR
jgi:hypothetical protein